MPYLLARVFSNEPSTHRFEEHSAKRRRVSEHLAIASLAPGDDEVVEVERKGVVLAELEICLVRTVGITSVPQRLTISRPSVEILTRLGLRRQLLRLQRPPQRRLVRQMKALSMKHAKHLSVCRVSSKSIIAPFDCLCSSRPTNTPSASTSIRRRRPQPSKTSVEWPN